MQNLTVYILRSLVVHVKCLYAIPPVYSSSSLPFVVPGAAVVGVALEPDPNAPTIDVTWSPLAEEFYNDAELTGYVIYYIPSDPEAPSGTAEVEPTSTSFTLTGLHQRVAYTVRIAAKNAIGIGPNSSEETAITSGLG